jgi:enoyl-CoA hydratase/carnithine racemase
MQLQDDYFAAYRSLKLTRDADGVLVVEFHSKGGPFTFTAQDHTEFVDAFYRIAQDRENKIVILTGAGGEFIPEIDFSSFGNVADPGVWNQVHDEGVQLLENIANIRVPVIAAIEGRAHVHSEYALLANVIVAGESATFHDVPHFAGGIVPGDGIFTTWSYRAGAGRAEAFLLNPQPLTAQTALEWGVIAEVVPNSKALPRAMELATLYLKAPEVTRRNTRVHFIQPLKERIVREVGYGLSLEGASAADLVKSMRAQNEPVARKRKSRMNGTESTSSVQVPKKTQPEEFDLVILGGGTGSTIAAWTFAGEGKQVAVVERKYIGGSCPNIACLPSKNIIHSAKVASYFRRSKEFGITHDGFAIDMAGVRERKRRMERWPERHVYGNLQEHGSRVHIGNGPVPSSENSGSHRGRWDHTSTAGHECDR